MRNYRQRNCPRCNTPMLHHTPGDGLAGCLRDDDWYTLSQFAAENGRFWRKKLIAMWDGGPEDAGWVRRVRNIVGPVDLAKVKPSKNFKSNLFGR